MRYRAFIGAMVFGLSIIIAADNVNAESQQEKNRGVISVTGTVREDYPPDTAEVILAVESTARTVTQAADNNKIITGKVINRLKRLISKDGGDMIKTSSYSLQPVYEYDRIMKKNKLTGYKARNEVTVKTGQINNIGKLIDNAIDEGANRVQSINFTILDDLDYCKALLKKASERARSEAEVVARSLGVKILGLKDVSASCSSETQEPVYRFGMMQQDAMMSKSTTPVEVGAIVLQGSVKTVFFIDNQ